MGSASPSREGPPSGHSRRSHGGPWERSNRRASPPAKRLIMTAARAEPPIFSDALRARRARLRRRDGHGDLPAPRFTNRSFDQSSSPTQTDRGHPPRILRGRGRRADHQHLRGEPVGLAKFGLGDKVRASTAPGRSRPGGWQTPLPAASSRGRLDRAAPLAARPTGLVEEMIAEQAGALREGGADFIIFETRDRAAPRLRPEQHRGEKPHARRARRLGDQYPRRSAGQLAFRRWLPPTASSGRRASRPCCTSAAATAT